MFLLLHKLIAKAFGRNLSFTPKEAVISQMNEARPLPTGLTEFHEWSDRIISGTLLPAEPESQKFALASMLMHLSPTTDHETDGYFIKSLRKGAVNQIAHAVMSDIRDRAKLRLEAAEGKTTQPDPTKPALEVVPKA